MQYDAIRSFESFILNKEINIVYSVLYLLGLAGEEYAENE